MVSVRVSGPTGLNESVDRRRCVRDTDSGRFRPRARPNERASRTAPSGRQDEMGAGPPLAGARAPTLSWNAIDDDSRPFDGVLDSPAARPSEIARREVERRAHRFAGLSAQLECSAEDLALEHARTDLALVFVVHGSVPRHVILPAVVRQDVTGERRKIISGSPAVF